MTVDKNNKERLGNVLSPFLKLPVPFPCVFWEHVQNLRIGSVHSLNICWVPVLCVRPGSTEGALRSECRPGLFCLLSFKHQFSTTLRAVWGSPEILDWTMWLVTPPMSTTCWVAVITEWGKRGGIDRQDCSSIKVSQSTHKKTLWNASQTPSFSSAAEKPLM